LTEKKKIYETIEIRDETEIKIFEKGVINDNGIRFPEYIHKAK
jgi:hypothetical protein